MDEDFGNILYIIFMIIAFVISIVAKLNKGSKSQKTHQPTVVTEDQSDPFQALENFFGETQKIKQVVVKEEVKSSAGKNAKPEMKSRERIKPSKSLFKDNEGEPSYWDEEEFNLRKAVIFSEILKRPEY